MHESTYNCVQLCMHASQLRTETKTPRLILCLPTECTDGVYLLERSTMIMLAFDHTLKGGATMHEIISSTTIISHF